MEAAIDHALHVVALAAAVAAAVWLLLIASPAGNDAQAFGHIVYAGALIGTLAASAAYTLSPPGRRKELLRRVDHAMIFMMIAGSYTPFTILVFGAPDGLLACLPVWAMAAIGIAVTLAYPRRFERPLFVLYVVMGWTVLAMARGFATHLTTPVLCLLLAGAAAYSIGACVHAVRQFRFQNVVWHTLVLLGASLHWMAVAQADTRL